MRRQAGTGTDPDAQEGAAPLVGDFAACSPAVPCAERGRSGPVHGCSPAYLRILTACLSDSIRSSPTLTTCPVWPGSGHWRGDSCCIARRAAYADRTGDNPSWRRWRALGHRALPRRGCACRRYRLLGRAGRRRRSGTRVRPGRPGEPMLAARRQFPAGIRSPSCAFSTGSCTGSAPGSLPAAAPARRGPITLTERNEQPVNKSAVMRA
jgi:hypothetical protein